MLGVEDEKWGQVGHAFIELSDSLPEDGIKAWCRKRLADFKVPKRFSFIDAMPRRTMDKVDRMRLAEMAAATGPSWAGGSRG